MLLRGVCPVTFGVGAAHVRWWSLALHLPASRKHRASRFLEGKVEAMSRTQMRKRPRAPSAGPMREPRSDPGASHIPREPDGHIVRIGCNLRWVKRGVKNKDRIHLDLSLGALLIVAAQEMYPLAPVTQERAQFGDHRTQVSARGMVPGGIALLG